MAERRPLYDAGNGSVKEFDPASGDTLAGGGSGGSSGINYVNNPDFEINTAGWAAYADAAGASPVDGTGGSPDVTITRTTSSPLRKTASGLITKDAANRQGNGVSYDFTIDVAQKGRALSVLFDYIVGSGTFVAGDASSDGDITVYVYDVTNARLIPLSDRKLYSNSSTLSSKFIGLFQASPDSTSYRLIIHCGSASASAYTLKFDEVQVSPLATFPATVVTDWIAYTPTFSSAWGGTPSGIDFYYKRVGDSILIRGYLKVNGTTTGSEGYLSLPSGLFMDLTKLKNVDMSNLLGFYDATDSSNAAGIYNNLRGALTNTVTGSNYIRFAYRTAPNSSSLYNPDGLSSLIANNYQIYVETFKIPIAGWGSAITSALTGDDGRVIVAKYTGTANATSSTSAPIQWNTKQIDTHNAVTTGSGWNFKAPISGMYEVSVAFSGQNGVLVYASIYVNGVDTGIITSGAFNQGVVSGSGIVEVKAGDTIDVRCTNSNTINAVSTFTISISRVAGNAVALGIMPDELRTVAFWHGNGSSGTVGTPNRSKNLTISRTTTGKYVASFLTNQPDTNYFKEGIISVNYTIAGAAPIEWEFDGSTEVASTISGFTFCTRDLVGNYFDPKYMEIIVKR